MHEDNIFQQHFHLKNSLFMKKNINNFTTRFKHKTFGRHQFNFDYILLCDLQSLPSIPLQCRKSSTSHLHFSVTHKNNVHTIGVFYLHLFQFIFYYLCSVTFQSNNLAQMTPQMKLSIYQFIFLTPNRDRDRLYFSNLYQDIVKWFENVQQDFQNVHIMTKEVILEQNW